MRNMTYFLLPLILLLNSADLRAKADEVWTEARCQQLRQVQTPDLNTQQQLQRHCSTTNASADSTLQVIPVQLDVQLPSAEVATPIATPPAPATPPRVQYNSTLEWLGSSMLLVLLAFWLWMGRQ